MDLVKLLVSHGALINTRDRHGNTPRDLAIQCDFYQCVDLLDELEGKLILIEANNSQLTRCTIQYIHVHV